MSTARIEENDSQPFLLIKFIASFFCIIFIRLFLENYSSPDNDGYFFGWQGYLLHGPLYFFSIFLSFTILTYSLSPSNITKQLNFLLKIFLFILVAPLVDLLFYGTQASSMRYVALGSNNILKIFFSLIQPFGTQGVTLGMHVSAYLILLSIALYIYKKTNSKIKLLLSCALGYFILFLYSIIPNFITIGAQRGGFYPIEIIYYKVLKQSWIATTLANQELTNSHSLDNFVHDILMGQIYWLLIVFQVTLLFAITHRQIWDSFKKNLRLERVFYWFAIATMGIFINQIIFHQVNLKNPANIISLITFFSIIALNIWFAVFVNDEEDIAIDQISNQNRPLIKKAISFPFWKNIQLVIFILLIFGTATLNNSTAFLLILAQSSYYIYSSQPFRFKKHYLSSSLLVGLAAVFVSMAGFFLVSPDQHIINFPDNQIWLIFLSFAILSNMKDIKDYEGDKNENIKTIPVVFGQKKACQIIALLYAAVIILIPIFLKLYSMLIFSFCLAAFAFFLFTKKKYEEKYIFVSYFLYMFTLLSVVLLK